MRSTSSSRGARLCRSLRVEHDEVDARALERALHPGGRASRGDAKAVLLEVAREHTA
jgi:hypothetical protein